MTDTKAESKCWGTEVGVFYTYDFGRGAETMGTHYYVCCECGSPCDVVEKKIL